jgi:nucleoside diphosphate kinase
MFGEEKEVTDYITSDVSVSLVLEKIGCINEWNLLIGPTSPDIARIYAPTSLRARLGINDIHNSIYSSENYEIAKRDIKLCFDKPFSLERTIAIIKPDMIENIDFILDIIKQNGFTILIREELTMSQARCEQFYSHLSNTPQFESICRYMSSGPIVCMILCKPAAIEAWRKLMGPMDPIQARIEKPNSLRARLGRGKHQRLL